MVHKIVVHEWYVKKTERNGESKLLGAKSVWFIWKKSRKLNIRCNTQEKLIASYMFDQGLEHFKTTVALRGSLA